MPPLFPDHDQKRIMAIRAEAGQDDAEALARLFEDAGLRGNGSPTRRIVTILAATERGWIKGLQTGLPFLDVGFHGDRERGGAGFRDPWPTSRNQVGHFLTAVGLAYRPALVSEPVLGRPLRSWLAADRALSDEQVARRLTIGHELAADPGLLGGMLIGGLATGALAPLLGMRGLLAVLVGLVAALAGAVAGGLVQQALGFRRQFARATPEDEIAFDRAVTALGSGPTLDLAAAEAELRPILDRIDVHSKGNSYQDLRLSLLGWSLGLALRTGAMTDGAEVAAWIRANLKAA